MTVRAFSLCSWLRRLERTPILIELVITETSVQFVETTRENTKNYMFILTVFVVDSCLRFLIREKYMVRKIIVYAV